MQPSVREALADASAALAAAGIASPALDARLLLQHVLNCTREWLVRNADEALPEAEAPRFAALLARRKAHTPIAHLLGRRAFWRDEFMVTPDVLIPRPDSETMLEALLKLCPDKSAPLRVLELGVGSGCLLLSTLREYENAHGVGIDVSPAAIEIAQKNCQALSLAARADFLCGNWCEPLASAARFDVVLSNPPYIPDGYIASLSDEVKNHEPHLALFGGEDGLKCYRTLLECLPKHMQPASVVLLEVGDGQAHDVIALAETQGFTQCGTFHDLGGIARVVALYSR